jgi:predicted nucleic acid-binding protein
MKPILLDTVTISELRKEGRMHGAVRAWQEQLPDKETWLSVVSVMEIRMGHLRVLNKDPVFAQRLESWLETTVIPLFEDRLFQIDLAIAREAAGMRVVHGLSPNDSLIAATAKVHGLTLATRNTADFEATGIALFNPWDFGK